MSFFTPYLADFFSRKAIIMGGVLLIGAANSFLSGSLFSIPPSVLTAVIGMALLGTSASMVIVVYLPELVSMAQSKLRYEITSVMQDKLSGTFNSFFSLGFFLAPIISGFLKETYSYSFSCAIMVCVDLVVFFMLFFYFVLPGKL